MRELGLEGARRGKPRRTTVADPRAARPADRVLDALEQALWTRQREGVTDLSGLV